MPTEIKVNQQKIRSEASWAVKTFCEGFIFVYWVKKMQHSYDIASD